MKTLKDVTIGETVVVKRLHGEGPARRRLMDMGIIKGVSIEVVKVAPWAIRLRYPSGIMRFRSDRLMQP